MSIQAAMRAISKVRKARGQIPVAGWPTETIRAMKSLCEKGCIGSVSGQRPASLGALT